MKEYTHIVRIWSEDFKAWAIYDVEDFKQYGFDAEPIRVEKI